MTIRMEAAMTREMVGDFPGLPARADPLKFRVLGVRIRGGSHA